MVGSIERQQISAQFVCRDSILQEMVYIKTQLKLLSKFKGTTISYYYFRDSYKKKQR